MLSAPIEGLIAKLDLVDLQAGIAIPVDYKHGHVPDVPGQAWEPERVQLCAQGLILRENGYLCEGGILYYVDSRKRISIPFDEALVDRTRELLQRTCAPPPRGEFCRRRWSIARNAPAARWWASACPTKPTCCNSAISAPHRPELTNGIHGGAWRVR